MYIFNPFFFFNYVSFFFKYRIFFKTNSIFYFKKKYLNKKKRKKNIFKKFKFFFKSFFFFNLKNLLNKKKYLINNNLLFKPFHSFKQYIFFNKNLIKTIYSSFYIKNNNMAAFHDINRYPFNLNNLNLENLDTLQILKSFIFYQFLNKKNKNLLKTSNIFFNFLKTEKKKYFKFKPKNRNKYHFLNFKKLTNNYDFDFFFSKNPLHVLNKIK